MKMNPDLRFYEKLEIIPILIKDNWLINWTLV